MQSKSLCEFHRGSGIGDTLRPIVEGVVGAAPDGATAAGVPGVAPAMGVYVKDVASGEETGIEADRRFPLASVFKVPVLVELYRQVGDGQIDLDRRLATRQPYAPGSGILRELDAGLAPTVRDLATLMIIRSDNHAADMIVDLVGLANVNATLRRLGVADVSVTLDCTGLLFTIVGLDPWQRDADAYAEYKRRSQSAYAPPAECLAFSESLENTAGSPRGMAHLFELILSGEAVDRAHCDQMLDILRRQQVNDRLPALLPDGVQVAHKTGSIRGVRNDCGVLFLDRGPVIVCCLTNGVDTAAAVKGIGEIGKAVYNHYA